jgi:Flp pilus assembly protein TadB
MAKRNWIISLLVAICIIVTGCNGQTAKEKKQRPQNCNKKSKKKKNHKKKKSWQKRRNEKKNENGKKQDLYT